MRKVQAGVPSILVALLLLAVLATPAAAAEPTVKLVLGGSGATSWAIGPIAPGQTGTKP